MLVQHIPGSMEHNTDILWEGLFCPGQGLTHPLVCLSHSIATLLFSYLPIFGSDNGSIDLSPGHNLSLFLSVYQVSTSYLSVYHSTMALIFQSDNCLTPQPSI